MLGSLTIVKVRSSIILPAPISECWLVCRAWGRQPWLPLLPDGATFDVTVLDGRSENEVGAVRCSKFGGGAQIFEKLTAIDDEKHIMKWQAVAHEDTINPFEEASFINFNTQLRLSAVSLGNTTFAEWTGEVYTEPSFASSMQDTFEAWYTFGMSSLKEYMARHQAKRKGTLYLPGVTSSRLSNDSFSSQSGLNLEHGPNSKASEKMASARSKYLR